MGIFSDIHTAMKKYNEKVNIELKNELKAKNNNEYPYYKNDVAMVSLMENENREFVYCEKLANFDGDHS